MKTNIKTLTAEETKDIDQFIQVTEEIAQYSKLFNREERKQLSPVELKRLSKDFQTMLKAENLMHPRVQEMTTSGKAEFLVPQVIIGPALEAADVEEPISAMFDKITYSGGSIVQFPAFGEMRAFVIPEGQEYPEQDFDMSQYRNLSIKVDKHGLMMRVTDEAIENCQWDLMARMMRAAGRAMRRLKAEQCIYAMLKHGHVLFDTMSADPNYQPTGIDVANNLNGTLSIMDFVDMLGAMMINEKTITDVIMHPLAFLTFFKNELIGAYGKGVINQLYPYQTPLAKTQMDSMASVIGRNLPIPCNPIITPWAPFDRVNMKFDIIAVDRDNVGVVIQKEELTTEGFDEPKRDVQCVKLREKYGIGIADQGRGIVIVKNLSASPTYFPPMRVHQV